MSAAEGPPQSALPPYQNEDGRTRGECRFADDTLWLTQAQMVGLFLTCVQSINLHLLSICAEGKHVPDATIKPYLMVCPEADALRQLEAAPKKLPKRRKPAPRRGKGE